MPTWLRAAVLLAVLIAAGVSANVASPAPSRAGPVCGSIPDVITGGPRLGEVTQAAATVWVRSCVQANVSVQYKPSTADWSSALTTAAVATDASADNTAVVSFASLQSATSYDYRVLVEDQLPANSPGGSFKTMPPSGGSVFSFIASSDMHFPATPSDMLLSTMAQQHAQFALLGGDQIEIEHILLNLGRCCLPQSQADYEGGYQGLFAYPAFASFVASTPSMLMWDDHEILNDWSQGSSATPYPWARGAFNEYAASANPAPRAPGALQYTFSAGDVGVYMLDTRSYRSPDMSPDGPDKTMLGVDQKQDLENWLLTSTARFKFIYSSVMWNSFAGHTFYGESWPAFQTERNEILDFIHDHQIPGVILLSGDEHWTGAFRLAPWGVYEIAPGPMTPGVYPTAATDPQILFKLGGYRTFGHFTVDTTVCPATLTIQLIGQSNQTPSAQPTTEFTLPLTEMDLGGDPDSDTLPNCQEAELGTSPNDPDTDGDHCGDGAELGPDSMAGGQRNPLDRWDYFDPTGDGLNRVNDILLVASKYFIDAGNPNYTQSTDRTFVGPEPWRTGAPNGVQRVDDVLAAAYSYYNDCTPAG